MKKYSVPTVRKRLENILKTLTLIELDLLEYTGKERDLMEN